MLHGQEPSGALCRLAPKFTIETTPQSQAARLIVKRIRTDVSPEHVCYLIGQSLQGVFASNRAVIGQADEAGTLVLECSVGFMNFVGEVAS